MSDPPCLRLHPAFSPARQWGSQPLGPALGLHGRPPRPAARTRRSSAGRLPGLGLQGARLRAGSVAPCLVSGLGAGVARAAPIAPPKRRSRSLDGLLDEPELALESGHELGASPSTAAGATATPSALLARPNWPDDLALSDSESRLDVYEASPSPERHTDKSESGGAEVDVEDAPPTGLLRETSSCPVKDSAEDTESSDRKRNFMDRCMNKMLSLMKK
ncbi:Transaldolase [Frankliniella fusca]|uniref:Transaldolase n=1 Tax=Frankliniella fusca TaxID=407009 RepID=A0AAE1LD23_9NEOP|nr:Transaldolase [Frankliniella fusca]